MKEEANMLSSVRGFVRSKAAAVIIGLLILGLAAYALPDVFSGSAQRGLISAGDRYVPRRDIDQRLDNYIAYQAAQGNQQTRVDLARNGIISALIQSVAAETAELAHADSLNMGASIYAVSRIVAEDPNFRSSLSGEFDREAYVNALARRNMTVLQYETLLRDELTRNYIQGALQAAVNAPEPMVQLLAQAQTEQRRISYVTVPSSVADTPIEPTDEELAAFYEERKQAFEQPERRAATLFVLSRRDFLDDAEISADDIQTYYDLRISDYSSPETRDVVQVSSSQRSLVQEFVDRVGAGESIDATLSTIEGLERLDRTLNPGDESTRELDQAIFAATLETPIGPAQIEGEWLAVFVTDIRPGTPRPLASVEEDIRAQLAEEIAYDLFEDAQENFYDLIGGGLELGEAATELGAPLMSFQAVDRQGRTEEGRVLPTLTGRPEAMEQLFELGYDGEVSVIMDDDETDGLMVVRLDRIDLRHVPPLADIEDAVRSGYVFTKRASALEDYANQLVSEAKIKGLQLAAEEKSLDVIKPQQALSRQSLPEGVGVETALAAFDVSEGDIFSTQASSGDFIVGTVDAIEPMDALQYEAVLMSARSSLRQGLIADLRNAYYGALTDEIDVSLNDEGIQNYINELAGVE